MMVKVPWLPAQEPTKALVDLIDIYPTLAELCRLPTPEYLQGTSVVPLLTDPTRLWKTAAFTTIGRGADSIRTDRYRLIQHPNGQTELYDLETDPDEDHNLAQEPAHAETVKSLQAKLNAGWKAALPLK